MSPLAPMKEQANADRLHDDLERLADALERLVELVAQLLDGERAICVRQAGAWVVREDRP